MSIEKQLHLKAVETADSDSITLILSRCYLPDLNPFYTLIWIREIV
jgi:hypothetical protein